MVEKLQNFIWGEKVLNETKWDTANRSKNQSAAEEGDAVYLVRLEGHGVLLVSSAKSYINKYCCDLNRLKVAINEKCLEMVNQKGVIFY